MTARVIITRAGGYDPEHPEAAHDPTLEAAAAPLDLATIRADVLAAANEYAEGSHAQTVVEQHVPALCDEVEALRRIIREAIASLPATPRIEETLAILDRAGGPEGGAS